MGNTVKHKEKIKWHDERVQFFNENEPERVLERKKNERRYNHVNFIVQ